MFIFFYSIIPGSGVLSLSPSPNNATPPISPAPPVVPPSPPTVAKEPEKAPPKVTVIYFSRHFFDICQTEKGKTTKE